MIIPLYVPGTMEIVIIVVVVLLLFGGKKIPEMMRGLGSGVKEFKKGIKEEEESKEAIPEDKRKRDEGDKEDK